ncbi:MAG: hypothetical protein K2W88_03890 [Pararheinheimera sp.]|nr:hypothetical protein [Rheinheimera sp.]
MLKHEVNWLRGLFASSAELASYQPVLDELVKQSSFIRLVRVDLCPISFLYQRLSANNDGADDAYLIKALLDLPIHAYQVLVGKIPYTLGVQQWPELREELKVEITPKQIDPDEVQAFINWVLLAAYCSSNEQTVPSKKLSASYH